MRQKSDDREQKSEDRRQKSESRRQKSESRSQRADDKGKKVRSWEGLKVRRKPLAEIGIPITISL